MEQLPGSKARADGFYGESVKRSEGPDFSLGPVRRQALRSCYITADL